MPGTIKNNAEPAFFRERGLKAGSEKRQVFIRKKFAEERERCSSMKSIVRDLRNDCQEDIFARKPVAAGNIWKKACSGG